MTAAAAYQSSIKPDCHVGFIDSLGEYLSVAGDDFDWMWAGQQIRQILEVHDRDTRPPQIGFDPGGIPDLRLRTLYIAVICYLFDQHGWTLPPTFEVAHPLDQAWSPRKRIRKSDTSPSEYFLRYNISIPSGELQWI